VPSSSGHDNTIIRPERHGCGKGGQLHGLGERSYGSITGEVVDLEIRLEPFAVGWVLGYDDSHEALPDRSSPTW